MGYEVFLQMMVRKRKLSFFYEPNTLMVSTIIAKLILISLVVFYQIAEYFNETFQV